MSLVEDNFDIIKDTDHDIITYSRYGIVYVPVLEVDVAKSSFIFDDKELDEEENELINYDHNFATVEHNVPDQEIGSLLNFNDRVPTIIDNIKNDYNKLTICQKKIVDYIKENLNKQNLLFIWGAAGTGKTFLIDYLSKMLFINNKEVAKLATTSKLNLQGLAAKLIRGRTLHGFFSIYCEFDNHLRIDYFY
ncbi:ATP-dependent DNA helicase pfh1 [Brachionus plicatilis]|uniref:ATP-dependent DNA helicase n=1 Tax=Brachionus plicatilis TaxID=10195 RepID=A0A3M7QWS5_BRAPC|nr:ATP-dependent DNA helicase pfh1 [Brachionus plicatilis]